MATQRFISTSFWDDRWVRSLDPSERYLYLYLITNPLTNIAGVYQVTIDRIAFDTGYDERTLKPMLQRFSDAKKAVYYHDEWMILPKWPTHQRWNKSKRIEEGIKKIVSELPEDVRQTMVEYGYTYPINTLSIPYAYSPSYSDTDTDTDRDTDSIEQAKPEKPTGKINHPTLDVPMTQGWYDRICDKWGRGKADHYIEKVMAWDASKDAGTKDFAARAATFMDRDFQNGKLSLPLRDEGPKTRAELRAMEDE